MKVRDLMKLLLDVDPDSEALQLTPDGDLRGFYTVYEKKGIVALGTGTYGTDDLVIGAAVQSYRRRRPARKAGHVRAR